jgi:preflagellin peptidase FlaK
MIDKFLLLDIIRFITGFIILLYASYTDLKTRRAPNILWLIMGLIGLSILSIQYLFYGFGNQVIYLIFIPLIIGIVYLFFQLRLIFGGADAKAIMALAILAPFFPFETLTSYPLYVSYMPFSWVIFVNSLLIFLIIPISLFIINLLRRNLQFPHFFMGYKVPIEIAKNSYVWPLEGFIDGKLHISFIPHSFDTSEQISLFEKKGYKKIWVTPKIPFMIPLLIGFITAFSLGDILTKLLQIIL